MSSFCERERGMIRNDARMACRSGHKITCCPFSMVESREIWVKAFLDERHFIKREKSRRYYQMNKKWINEQRKAKRMKLKEALDT